MKNLFILLAICITATSFGQSVAILDFNDVRAKVLSNGTLFDGTYEVPKPTINSGINSIYTSCFWIGGLDASSQLHIAAEIFGGANKDFFFGPVATNYTNPTYTSKYNKVWSVDRLAIQTHIANYTTPGYVVPASIANWPSNGNVANGEAAVLAPYVDVNTNGTYDPENGDYPCIRGDMAMFYMVNDDKQTHTATGGAKLGIELHGMLYCYATNDAINQQIFGHFTIYNRSATNYNNVYIGAFADMDLGYYDDDYVGSDSLLNMFYTYNADNFDEDASGTLGYGAKPPAQGLMFLNQPISKFISFNSSSSTTGLPSTALHYYQYLKGIWKDGTPLTQGGNGYGGVTPANFMFSGKPENFTGWTEGGAGMFAEDTRGLISTGPLNLPSGQMITLDVAYPFGWDNTGSNTSSVGLLRTNAQLAKDLYSFETFCSTLTGLNTQVIETNSPIIYPNPSNGKLFISNSNSIKLIEVYDIIGHKILSIKNQTINEIDLSNAPKGIYFVKLLIDNKLYTDKIIVE